MKWTNSYRSFGLKTKRSTGLKTIEHKHTPGVRPNDSAGGRVGSPSCARSMGGRAPMNAPGAAI